MAKKFSIFDHVRAELYKIGAVLISLPAEYAIRLKTQTDKDGLIFEDLREAAAEGLRLAEEAREQEMAMVTQTLNRLLHGNGDTDNE